jgi:hypothetical protein
VRVRAASRALRRQSPNPPIFSASDAPRAWAPSFSSQRLQPASAQCVCACACACVLCCRESSSPARAARSRHAGSGLCARGWGSAPKRCVLSTLLRAT